MDNNRDYNRDYNRDDSFRDDYDMETSAEFAHTRSYSRDRADTDVRGGSTWSFIGIIFAVLSMFWMPTTFAIIGLIMGIVGTTRHSVGLGVTAIILSGASLLMNFLWVPNWV